jgi:superfamily II DNA or RNA helicase
MMPPPADRFVMERSDPIGFGWCAEVVDEMATVRYFDLPDSVAEERRVPVAGLMVRDLPLEMRVWVRNKGFGWWPGRTKGRDRDGSYFVQLAGAGPAVRVPPWSIQVRWDKPLASATEALAIGMTDSPQFHDARYSVMSNLVHQRAACRGFTAVLSASVRPFHHQIDVLTRVLNDPVMRFVLADEVGLGKTIEAGLIIRQLFLDQPHSRVVVCTPKTLCGQWFDELAGKLRLRQQLSSTLLRVIDHSELSELRAEPPDLLVVDEAHQMVQQAINDTDEMEQLRTVAQAVPSLLLLTATPLRGNADTFLGLLHLIDAEAYALDDIEVFRRRLELRHEQASSIELLSPRLPRAVVRGVLDEFAASYEADRRLKVLITKAQAAIESGSESEGDLDAVANHMRETYRLSRRVIRHRRSAAAADGFPVSGRRLELVALRDPVRDAIDDFLEQWRRCLRSDEEIAVGPTIYARGVEAGLGGPSAILEFIDWRIKMIASGRNATESALLHQTRALLARRRGNARLEALVDRIGARGYERPCKTVVFTGFSTVGKEVGDALSERLGVGHVALHLESMTSGEQDDAVRRFLHDSSVVVLVCDASGEEGRNLQAASQLIHLDIPLSINRLEQRIGRADRFNETSLVGGVPSVVFAEPGSPWTSGHLHLLTQGVRVFEQSVATLQRPLADYEQELTERLLELGVGAFELDVDALRERFDDERNQIDLLEELESTLTKREFSPAQIQDLVDFEEAWPQTADAFNRLTSNSGGILLRRSDRQDVAGAMTYSIDPTLKAVPLMPANYQEQLVALLPGRRTFSRAVALEHPGVHLLRVGDPLVDWIENYLRIDEGGQARAMWLHVPDWPDPTVWFCFDFLLEFDERMLGDLDTGTRRRMRRRGDAFLPPRMDRVWTDGVVEAPGDLVNSALERSAETGVSSVALRGPRWTRALDLFPNWPSLCRDAEKKANEIVTTRPEVLDWSRSAQAAALDEATRRQQVLELWAERLPSGHQRDRARRELEMERALGAEVTAGVSTPRCSLFAVGGAIVAGVSPDD